MSKVKVAGSIDFMVDGVRTPPQAGHATSGVFVPAVKVVTFGRSTATSVVPEVPVEVDDQGRISRNGSLIVELDNLADPAWVFPSVAPDRAQWTLMLRDVYDPTTGEYVGIPPQHLVLTEDGTDGAGVNWLGHRLTVERRGVAVTRGAPGEVATVDVGTTTTSAPGGPAQVVPRGTDSERVLDFVLPRGAQGPQGPAGQWATGAAEDLFSVEQMIRNSTTVRAAIRERIANETGRVNANLRGVVANGSLGDVVAGTDDAAAWNALITEYSQAYVTLGIKTILTWTGISTIKSAIAPKPGVSIIGRGHGVSVLKPTYDANAGTPQHFAALYRSEPNNYLTDCTFADFEIDGNAQHPTSSIASKGVDTRYNRRCTFRNLYIHDTRGTGLATDWPDDVMVVENILERCGKGWAEVGGGGRAGIGIGYGKQPSERCIIAGNVAIDCGHYGIFVEYQGGFEYHSGGAIIVNNTVKGAAIGISDRGCGGTIIANNYVTGTTDQGIALSYGTFDCTVANNIVVDNFGDGIFLENDIVGRCALRGNKCGRNGKNGFNAVAGLAGVYELRYDGNESFDNGYNGYRFSTAAGATASPGFVDFLFARNSAHNNGKAAAGNSALNRAVRFDCSLSGFDISANRCSDRQATKTQLVGLNLPASASFTLSDGTIINNHLRGNGAGNAASALALGAAVRTNVRIEGNMGFLTETSGSVTIAAGQQTSGNVNHGLVAAPTTVTVSRVANTPGTTTAPPDVWVDTVGSGAVIFRRPAGTLAEPWIVHYTARVRL